MLNLIRIKNNVFGSNSYIIDEGQDEILLVDCGDLKPILQYNKYVKGILLTHVHYDHIYGIPKILECFPNLKIYTQKFGIEALSSNQKKFSRYHGDSIEIYNDNRILTINNGDNIKFLGLTANTIFTPGHAPSCITWQIGNWLFTGDSLIPGIKTVTNLPGGNKELALVSEEKIKTLVSERNLIICPSHGELTYP